MHVCTGGSPVQNTTVVRRAAAGDECPPQLFSKQTPHAHINNGLSVYFEREDIRAGRPVGRMDEAGGGKDEDSTGVDELVSLCSFPAV